MSMEILTAIWIANIFIYLAMLCIMIGSYFLSGRSFWNMFIIIMLYLIVAGGLLYPSIVDLFNV